MRNIVPVIAVILLSCISSQKGKVTNTIKAAKFLDFLSNYEGRVDSIGNKRIVYYEKIGLRQEQSGTLFKILYNDKLIFEGDKEKNHYLFEVFDSSYLVISYAYGRSGAAGPDLFERDSMVLFDLDSATPNRVNLNKIYLTRSKEFLFNSYRCRSDSLKNKNFYRYCAIDSVDKNNHRLILINECRHREEIEMTRQ